MKIYQSPDYPGITFISYNAFEEALPAGDDTLRIPLFRRVVVRNDKFNLAVYPWATRFTKKPEWVELSKDTWFTWATGKPPEPPPPPKEVMKPVLVKLSGMAEQLIEKILKGRNALSTATAKKATANL